MKFTVVSRGQTITFESRFDSLDAAVKALDISSDFAASLRRAFNNRGLSDKQAGWCHYLATERIKEEEKRDQPGIFENLVKQMYKTSAKRYTLRLPNDIRISIVSNGRNAGSLYIKEGEMYVGNITPEGHTSIQNDDILSVLEDANEEGNLVKLAKAYGYETGSCSCCGRTLSDPQSVALGIGPICLSKYF